jgi:hypothetical protein
MKVKGLAFLTAGLLTFALISAPSSASAAEVCAIDAPRVTNAGKPVGIKYSVTRTVTVRLTNCTASQASNTTVRWWVNNIEGGSAPLATLARTSLGDNSYSYKGSIADRPADLVNFNAGTYETSIRTARGSARAERAAPPVKLLRAARFVNFNASPEPVKKGKIIVIKGQLQRASWNSLKYLSHYSAEPTLQFRTKTGSYLNIETMFWDAAPGFGDVGGYYTEVKAAQDGCFRMVYKGSRTTGAVTSTADCIDVR